MSREVVPVGDDAVTLKMSELLTVPRKVTVSVIPVNSGVCLLYAVQCELDSVATYVESSATVGGNRGAIFRPETNHVAGCNLISIYRKSSWIASLFLIRDLYLD